MAEYWSLIGILERMNKVRFLIRLLFIGFCCLAVSLIVWWFTHKYSTVDYMATDPDWTFSIAGNQYGLVQFSGPNFLGCETYICLGPAFFAIPLPLYLFVCVVVCGAVFVADFALRRKSAKPPNKSCCGSLRLGRIMRQSIKYMLLSLAAAGTLISAGCISRRAGAGLSAVVIEAAIKPIFDPVFELAYAANEFREVKKRWPKDYDELSGFLKQSDDKTYQAFQTTKYDRIDFVETADGKLTINADYTLDSGGTGRIEGMKVTAFDPREMTLMPNTAMEPTARVPSVSTNK